MERELRSFIYYLNGSPCKDNGVLSIGSVTRARRELDKSYVNIEYRYSSWVAS